MSSHEIVTDKTAFPSALRKEYDCLSCLRWSDEGSTWLCLRRDTGEQVLVKTACGAEASSRLRNEHELLRLIAASGKPAAGRFSKALALFPLPEREDSLVFVRSYWPGLSLESLVESQPSRPGLPRDRAIRYMLDVLDQLSFLHHLRPAVIHRDIKPQNVIVDDRDQCHLIDLDISRIQRKQEDSDTLVMGTRLTAPPEQYGFRPTDARSDIYSAGVLTRYCLTGEYDAGADADLPADLQPIIRKATRFDPADRYQRVEAFQTDLRAVSCGIQRRKISRIGLSAAVLLVLAAGALLYLRHPASEKEMESAVKPGITEAVSAGTNAAWDGRPIVISEEMFNGDTELYEMFQKKKYNEMTAAITPKGLRFVRYIEYYDRIFSLDQGRTALSAEELTAVLDALTKTGWWAKGTNLLVIGRGVESLEPFRIKYLNENMCLEFHNCTLPSDPEPLSAFAPALYEFACYNCTPLNWNSLDFLRNADHLDVLDLTFDGARAVDLSVLEYLPTLRILRLNNASMGREALEAVGRMKKLEVLSLVSCGITDITPLSGLIRLTELNLTGNPIDDFSPVEVLSALERLSPDAADSQ